MGIESSDADFPDFTDDAVPSTRSEEQIELVLSALSSMFCIASEGETVDAFIPISILLIGGAIGFAIARAFRSHGTVSQEELVEIRSAQSASEARCEGLTKQNEELAQRLQASERERQAARERVASLETERDALNSRITQHAADLEKMQERFRLEFENLAGKIFEEKSKTFKEQSTVSIGELLNPLKEKLGEFHKKVEDSFGTQAKEQFALKNEIARIVKANEEMKLGAEQLTKALRGDTQVQGSWGEVMLEKILEEAGLRRGEDYLVQGGEMGLKHVDTGGTLKPDVIVNLPEGKHIIIDSKVSLVHYEQYVAAEDDAQRDAALKQFLLSTRNHIIGLEKRRYQDVDKLGTPDFVLMFMPIEGAYALAVQREKELHGFAWDKRIVIVCPTTLFATLRTIANVWRLERQNQNALEIAKEGGALYDKIAAFVEDMRKLGAQMDTTQKTYREAIGKLSDGRGNILRRAEKMRMMGVDSTKRLPEGFTGSDEDEEGETSSKNSEIVRLVENDS